MSDERQRVAEAPVELRHVVEVHAVDVPISVGANRMAAQAEIFCTCSFWSTETSVRAFVSSVRWTLRMFWSSVAEAVDPLLDAQGVVLHVAQVAALLVVHAGQLDQLSEDARERLGRALELDHLARQLVDAPRDGGAAAEDLVLDLVDVVLETGDDRLVAVDDVVGDAVDDRDRSAGEQLRAAPRASA